MLFRAGKPAIEGSELWGRQIFVERNPHAQAGTHIDDARRKIECLACVRQADAHNGFHRRWIEGVNVTTGAADVAGARVEPSPAGDFGDFHGGNEWYARIVTLVLHRA